MLLVCPLLSVTRDVQFLGGGVRFLGEASGRYGYPSSGPISSGMDDTVGRQALHRPLGDLTVHLKHKTLKWTSVLHEGPTQNTQFIACKLNIFSFLYAVSGSNVDGKKTVGAGL